MKSMELKLLLSFVTVILILVFQGLFAAYTTKKVYDVYGAAKDRELAGKSLQNRLMGNRLLIYRILGTFDPGEMDRLKAEYEETCRSIPGMFHKIGQSPSDFETLKADYDELIALHYDFFTRLAAKQLNSTSKEMFIKLDERLNIYMGNLAAASREHIRHTWITGLWFTGAVCLAALGISLFWAAILKKTLKDRDKVQKAMADLREYLQNIVDSMPSMLVAVDGDHNIIQWNSEARRLTGRSAQEATGRHILDVLPRFTGEMHLLQRTLNLGVVEQRLKAEDPKSYPPEFWDIIIYPLHVKGMPGAVIRMDRVTERVRMEDLMVQTEKMLSVGSLAAGMAHEIRNPLGGILQNLQNLERRLNLGTSHDIAAAEETGIDPSAWRAFRDKRKINRMINSIRESGRRATDIVDNLLTFSRKTKTEFHRHDPIHLMDQAIELAAKDYSLKKHFDFRNIAIVRQYDSAVPQIFCMGSMVQQVFLNLLKNGAQAMHDNPPGKKPQFTISISGNKDFVSFEIRDNGPGMSKDIQRRAFEPFFTTKAIGQGTGLGLSVSYFIITEQHHGEMHLFSIPGQGSRFSIRLPLNGPDGNAGTV